MTGLHVQFSVKLLLFLVRILFLGLRKIAGLDFECVGFLRKIFLDLIFVGDKVVKKGLVFLVLVFMFGIGGELVGLGIGDVLGGFLER